MFETCRVLRRNCCSATPLCRCEQGWLSNSDLPTVAQLPSSGTITIPRMELTVVTVPNRLGLGLDILWRKELQMQLQNSVFWTGSTSLLKYINNDPSRFRTFVTIRVLYILSLSRSSQWRYLNTSNNPVDLTSRVLKVYLSPSLGRVADKPLSFRRNLA